MVFITVACTVCGAGQMIERRRRSRSNSYYEPCGADTYTRLDDGRRVDDGVRVRQANGTYVADDGTESWVDEQDESVPVKRGLCANEIMEESY
ncbi:MAG: hypothetical protein OXQ29_04200 [Rhodospirillaceae bacterium]|nr:hypothetical protein [Rhodospirillaceae bacterium]